MSSLVSHESMDRLYKETGATLLRHPWGLRYDPSLGPDKRSPWVVFPDAGVSHPDALKNPRLPAVTPRP